VDITAWIEYVLECYEAGFVEALARISQQPKDMNDGDRIEKALSLFRRHKKLKAADYETIMNIGRTQAVEDLNGLIKRKLILKQGGGRSTVYILKE
jgi:Fic family protein